MSIAHKALAIALAVSLPACGSELVPPPGYFAGQDTGGEPDLGPADATPDVADVPSVEPECATDLECAGKFALYQCQEAYCNDVGICAVRLAADNLDCDDGNACSLGETCQDGICLATKSLACNDGDDCTDDGCDPEQGCVYSFNEDPCDDGEPCTVDDRCDQGACAGTPTSACYSGSCCIANDTRGCEDMAINDCVCAVQPACCDGPWTASCVALIESADCGVCPSATCADGECTASESCASCPLDCGYCEGCGDDYCDEAENCFSCPLDCGECANPVCGDGLCSDGEDCSSCPLECGCGGHYCGDGSCDVAENCQTCSVDCGDCPPGCGDGLCSLGNESCETCSLDCGVCTGDCCEAKDGPGCSSQAIEDCVCNDDLYCCKVQWDGVCVAQIATEGCGNCDGIVCGNGVCDKPDESCETCEFDCGECPFCGDGTCDAPDEDCYGCEQDCGECANECCEVQSGPGCGDPDIEDCVCAFDFYCCDFAWDSACVSEVETYNCGSCSGPAVCGDGQCNGGENCNTCQIDCGDCNTGDCCTPHPTPGCSNLTISDCVCNFDFFCCFFSWDASCVDSVNMYGCGTCP